MLTVACVCVEGGVYNESHVWRLLNMVKEHLTIPFGLSLAFASELPGWWAKIDLFEPRRFKGRVLYLDLDVTITGPLDGLATYPAPFVAIRDFIRPGLNSSVMSWDAGAADHVYENFTPDVMQRLHGDQDWITEQMPNAARFPMGTCVSYRGHVVPRGRVPKSASVVVFHGSPKPWEVPPLVA
ncbi:MAG: hypothetical protein NUV72_05075 [Bauldia sp.]|nr:hypothetical protein [Bauldia sp.]